MRELAEKLRSLEEELSTEKGAFSLFGLFLREDAPDVWDLVVAADWLEKNRSAGLRLLAKRVRDTLGPQLIARISRVVIVDEDNPALGAVNRAVNAQHGIAEIANSTLFGLPIRHAYIITSRTQRAA